MKITSKVIVLLLTIGMTFSIVGCGARKAPDSLAAKYFMEELDGRDDGYMTMHIESVKVIGHESGNSSDKDVLYVTYEVTWEKNPGAKLQGEDKKTIKYFMGLACKKRSDGWAVYDTITGYHLDEIMKEYGLDSMEYERDYPSMSYGG